MAKRFGHGLFIGRFQPFHKGHLHALESASSLCSELAIGVGSSQEAGTDSNPLPARTRIRIIRAGLKGTGLDAKRIRFFEIPDSDSNDAWFCSIMGRYPKVDVVFSRTRLVKKIFSGHGITVVSPEWYLRRRLSATRIRYLIRRGKGWQDRIPEGAIGAVAAHEVAIRRARGRIIEKRR